MVGVRLVTFDVVMEEIAVDFVADNVAEEVIVAEIEGIVVVRVVRAAAGPRIAAAVRVKTGILVDCQCNVEKIVLGRRG